MLGRIASMTGAMGVAAAVCGALVACAGSEDTPALPDWSRPRKDLLGPEQRALVDASCPLGTAESCGACRRACPGVDTTSTRRICTNPTSTGTCDVVCLGESYDVDGNLQTGCEAADTPVQDSAATAVAQILPDVKGTGGETPCDGTKNPCTVTGRIYSDGRTHEVPPAQRPNGRDDWYKVVAVGPGVDTNSMTACLGIANFPADNRYMVCISEDKSQSPGNCGTVQAGPETICARPTAKVDSGTFYVRIQKLGGTATANGYALYLVH